MRERACERERVRESERERDKWKFDYKTMGKWTNVLFMLMMIFCLWSDPWNPRYFFVCPEPKKNNVKYCYHFDYYQHSMFSACTVCLLSEEILIKILHFCRHVVANKAHRPKPFNWICNSSRLCLPLSLSLSLSLLLFLSLPPLSLSLVFTRSSVMVIFRVEAYRMSGERRKKNNTEVSTLVRQCISVKSEKIMCFEYLKLQEITDHRVQWRNWNKVWVLVGSRTIFIYIWLIPIHAATAGGPTPFHKPTAKNALLL